MPNAFAITGNELGTLFGPLRAFFSNSGTRLRRKSIEEVPAVADLLEVEGLGQPCHRNGHPEIVA